MDPWMLGLVAVIVLGLGLILYGALVDRRRNRRAREEMLSPPRRQIPGFRQDAPTPQYLSELQARRSPPDAEPTALSDAERSLLEARLREPGAIVVEKGYAGSSFVTDARSGWAVLDDAVVLVCGDGVESVRELLPAMERSALSQHPLVIAAPAISADVLGTLEVNVIQRKLRLLALVADKHTLATIAAHTGARPLERSDLQAGFLPVAQLGSCARWVSDQKRSWLLSAVSSA